jgi:hypothetical protein
MIYLVILFVSLLPVAPLQCTSFGSTANKDLKQPVNYYGKVLTHQGQEYVVDNISIDNKCKQIPMYDKPVNHVDPVFNAETKHQEIKLDTDPANDITKIDLNELKTIRVPQPNVIWFYQKKENYPRQEFIEVEITTKSNTKRSYLLDAKTPIYCDEIDSAGPQEKTIRLAAIDTISIEGFSYRQEARKDNSCPPCNPCSAKKEE